MNIISNQRFLTLGVEAVKKTAIVAAIGFGVIATASFANHFMENAISNHGHTAIQSLADTVNDISYHYTGNAITQSNEEYRQGVMERHMLDRVGYSFVLADEVDKNENAIIKENLNKAQQLGLFEDKNDELFRKEMVLLDSAQKHDGSNGRIFSFDRGVNDPSDPSHFDVKDLSQLKTQVEKNLLEIRAKSENPRKDIKIKPV